MTIAEIVKKVRSGRYNTKAISRDTGISTATIYRMKKEDVEHKDETFALLADWLRDPRDLRPGVRS